MKNNFNLRTFLTENKLTPNSKINENQLPDDTKSLKASDAFRQVGIDMNEPVLVLTQDGGHGEQETKGTVSAREALKMFQQLRAKGMEDDKQDYYEFENELNFSAEGYEYKIAYFEEEATTTALMQKSGVSEKKVTEEESKPIREYSDDDDEQEWREEFPEAIKYSWEWDDEGVEAVDHHIDMLFSRGAPDISKEEAMEMMGRPDDETKKAFNQAFITQMQETDDTGGDEMDYQYTINLLYAYEKTYGEPFNTNLIKFLSAWKDEKPKTYDEYKKYVSNLLGKEISEADRDEESMVHELIGDLFAPGNARSHLDFSVKEIARNLKRYGDHLTRQGVKDAMDLYDKLAADGTLDKEVEDGDGFVSSYHVPKLKKAFELIGLYGSEVNENITVKQKNKMKNNFNLRTFLTENKLTSNSKIKVSEIDADLLKRAQNTPAPKDAKSMGTDKGLRASMGPNAEQEQKVIDIARDAIDLMDEQPGTSAEDALAAVLDI